METSYQPGLSHRLATGRTCTQATVCRELGYMLGMQRGTGASAEDRRVSGQVRCRVLSAPVGEEEDP